MIGALLFLLGPVVLGSWVVRACFGARGPGWGLTVSMGAVVGMGLASVALWLGLWVGVPLGFWRWVEVVGIAAAAWVTWRWWRGDHGDGDGGGDAHDGVRVSVRLGRIIGGVALVCLLAAVAAMVAKGVLCRHGEWDAWAIWNLHARFLFRGGGMGYVDPIMEWTHPDYPLLVPLTVVRGWLLGWGESVWVPAVIGPVYTLAGAGVVYFGLARYHGLVSARLALICLMAAPVVSQNAAGQLADSPLAVNVLLVVASCWLGAARPRLLLLAGLAAGLAAWTKNEGLLVLPALAGALAPALIRSRAEAGRRLAWTGVGLLPGLAALATFWPRVGGYSSGALATLTRDQALAFLATPGRHLAVATRYALEPLNLRAWGAAPLCLLLALAALGLSQTPRRRAALGAGAVVLLLQAAHYLLFVVIPGDHQWLMDSALHRLLLHGFPALLLSTWALARPVHVRQ